MRDTDTDDIVRKCGRIVVELADALEGEPEPRYRDKMASSSLSRIDCDHLCSLGVRMEHVVDECGLTMNPHEYEPTDESLADTTRQALLARTAKNLLKGLRFVEDGINLDFLCEAVSEHDLVRELIGDPSEVAADDVAGFARREWRRVALGTLDALATACRYRKKVMRVRQMTESHVSAIEAAGMSGTDTSDLMVVIEREVGEAVRWLRREEGARPEPETTPKDTTQKGR